MLHYHSENKSFSAMGDYFVKGYYSHAIVAPICAVSERDEKALTDVVALLFSYIVRDTTTRHGIKAYT